MKLDHKQGARIRGLRAEILWAVCVADKVFDEYNAEVVITSGMDGKHSRGSIHYSGGAVDLRIWDIDENKREQVVIDLKYALGPDFDIILESNHIHMEYQPHEE